MANRSGFLTVYSADRSEIYGEFADATWETQNDDDRMTNVFAGTAGDGTMQTFLRVDANGIDHVAFDYDSNGERFTGTAQLLAPADGRIQIETFEQPIKA